MAGRFEGLSDLEWKLFEDVFPETPKKRGRGMPPVPFRYVLNSLLYILITGCRWCDLPQGKIWASKSSATNRVRPMLSAWTNRRFVVVKKMARAGARRQRSCRSNVVARWNI